MAFENKDYEEAKTKYEAALSLKSESYPQDQLNKIAEALSTLALRKQEEEKAAAAAKKELEFQAFIAKADAFYEEGHLEEAREEYINAISLKEESYPALKIAEIDQKLEALALEKVQKQQEEQLEANYQAAIADADQALSQQNYSAATGKYEEALSLKPNESYPAEKLKEIEGLVENAKKEAAKIEAKYQDLIVSADLDLEAENLEQAKATYLAALALKPRETYPTQKVEEINQVLDQQAQKEEEIRLEKERTAQREADYHNAVAKADQFLEEKNYKEALVQYGNAQSLIPSEEYPESQISKINRIMAQLQKEQEETARKENEEEQFNSLIASADQALNNEQYRLAAKNYRAALRIKSDESYPREQLAFVEDILEEQRKAERESKRLVDEPIKIQTGPRATLENSAEDDIDKMYAELWAKNKQSKAERLENVQKSVSELQDAQREEEHQKRQEAYERIEAISISLQQEQEEKQELNLQNYEEVLNTEDALKRTKISNNREADGRRNEAYVANQNLESNRIAYQKQQENRKEGFAEEVEDQYKREARLKEKRVQNQQERIGINKTKVEEHAEAVENYKVQRTQEQAERNKLDLDETEEGWKNLRDVYETSSKERIDNNYATIEDKQSAIQDLHQERIVSYKKQQGKIEDDSKVYKDFDNSRAEMAKERIRANQQRNEDLLASLNNQSASRNLQHKEGYERIETKQLALEEERKAREAASEARRQANLEQDFYKGEKKPRENREAENYPQGITEKVLEGNNSTTIRRIVVNGTQVDIYEKTLYQYGEVFYSKNGTSITKETWNKESVE